MFSGCPSVCLWSRTKSLLPRYLKNRLWEFHQMFNFGAVGDKDELIRFDFKRSTVKVTARTRYGHISTLIGIFSLLSGTH